MWLKGMQAWPQWQWTPSALASDPKNNIKACSSYSIGYQTHSLFELVIARRYRLEYFEQTPPPADQQPEASPALLAKRRHSGSPATVAKRPRTDVDAADLLQLKAKNDVRDVYKLTLCFTACLKCCDRCILLQSLNLL